MNASNYVLGRTPLMAACTRPSVACIRLLLDYGADVNARTPNGLDALVYLVEEDRNPQPLTEIRTSARLLIDHGISLEPHGQNHVWCLARAARTQLIEVMEMITNQGIDINLKNNFGLTVLARSIDWSAEQSVRFLLHNHASYTGSEQFDGDGKTVLHHLALNPQLEVIKAFLELGKHSLDPEGIDNQGFKAEQYFDKVQDIGFGVAPAFKELLANLRPTMASRSDRDDDEGQTFFDTVEDTDDYSDAVETQET